MKWLEYIQQNSTVDDNSCWSWNGKKTKRGRPLISLWLRSSDRDETFKDISCQAASYWFGRMPNLDLRDVRVKATCDSSNCVNPDHLEEE